MAESEEDRRYRRRLELATDPDARVMVFVDGQYLWKECRRLFGHGQCHPDVLAKELAGPRKLVGTRFYTGLHDPRKFPDQHAAMQRRLYAMQRRGVDFQTRTLQYVWDWGPRLPERRRLPKAGPNVPPRNLEIAPYERPVEKGIDMFLALDAVDLALLEKFDVAIVVSLDRDIAEVPPMLRQMVRRLRRQEIRVEAAVLEHPGRRRPRAGPTVLPGYDYTHQITEEMYRRAIDTTDYRVPAGAAPAPATMSLPLDVEDEEGSDEPAPAPG